MCHNRQMNICRLQVWCCYNDAGSLLSIITTLLCKFSQEKNLQEFCDNIMLTIPRVKTVMKIKLNSVSFMMDQHKAFWYKRTILSMSTLWNLEENYFFVSYCSTKLPPICIYRGINLYSNRYSVFRTLTLLNAYGNLKH